MRVVQLKRGRIVKFAALGLALLGLLVLVAQKSGYKLRSQLEAGSEDGLRPQGLQGGPGAGQGHVKDQSYPQDLPKFRGLGIAGNFEPDGKVR